MVEAGQRFMSGCIGGFNNLTEELPRKSECGSLQLVDYIDGRYMKSYLYACGYFPHFWGGWGGGNGINDTKQFLPAFDVVITRSSHVFGLRLLVWRGVLQ